MRKLILALLVTPSLFIEAQTGVQHREKKTNPATFAKMITPADLRKHLYIVAGKEMEGRETATEGQRKAAQYIEE